MARHYLGSKLSGEQLSLGEVWEWYEFQAALIGEERARTLDALLTRTEVNELYFGQARDELVGFFDWQRAELMHVAMLTLIAATEAALRVD